MWARERAHIKDIDYNYCSFFQFVFMFYDHSFVSLSLVKRVMWLELTEEICLDLHKSLITYHIHTVVTLFSRNLAVIFIVLLAVIFSRNLLFLQSRYFCFVWTKKQKEPSNPCTLVKFHFTVLLPFAQFCCCNTCLKHCLYVLFCRLHHRRNNHYSHHHN